MSRFPWKPVRVEFDFDREIDNAFEQIIHSQWGPAVSIEQWRPEIDVYETDDAYIVQADVPGVTCEELRVEVTGQWLILSGSRESTGMERTAYGLRLERRHGSFSRRFYLNEPVDTDHIEHICHDGLHRIRLNKCRSH